MRLAFDFAGPVGVGRPVAFVHGFTQTGRSWLPVAERLRDVESTLIDAPGHGSSGDIVADLRTGADMIASTMRRGDLVGYSMGARFALHTALQHPEQVSTLVLVSGTPGIENDTERAARRAADEALADRIESMALVDFLEEWLANPMFSGLTEATRNIADRMRNFPGGLASSLRHAGTGTQEPLWDRLHELRCPVLVVCGAADTKFRGIGERMHSMIPGSTFIVVEEAGHTVHLEQTDRFVGTLLDWFSTHH